MGIITLAALTFGLGYEIMRGFVSHPSYMKWALFGGTYRPDFGRCFFDDKFSQEIVIGKTVDELKKWFPEMRSEKWVADQEKRLSNWMDREIDGLPLDYQPPKREKDVYITGVDEFAGIFIQVDNGIATKAFLLKDIGNQRVPPSLQAALDSLEAKRCKEHP